MCWENGLWFMLVWAFVYSRISRCLRKQSSVFWSEHTDRVEWSTVQEIQPLIGRTLVDQSGKWSARTLDWSLYFGKFDCTYWLRFVYYLGILVSKNPHLTICIVRMEDGFLSICCNFYLFGFVWTMPKVRFFFLFCFRCIWIGLLHELVLLYDYCSNFNICLGLLYKLVLLIGNKFKFL